METKKTELNQEEMANAAGGKTANDLSSPIHQEERMIDKFTDIVRTLYKKMFVRESTLK